MASCRFDRRACIESMQPQTALRGSLPLVLTRCLKAMVLPLVRSPVIKKYINFPSAYRFQATGARAKNGEIMKKYML
jgi:hypothetical protein